MPKKPLPFILHYMALYKKQFCAMAIFLIIGQTMGKVSEYYMAEVVATVVSEPAGQGFWQNIQGSLSIFILMMGLSKLLEWFPLSISAKFYPKLRTLVVKDCFEYVNRQSIAYFHEEMSGNIANKVSLLTNGLMEILNTLQNGAYTLFMLIIITVLLCLQSWYFGFFISIWIFVAVIYSMFLGKTRAVLAKETGKQKSLVSGMLVDSISNYSEIKSFANFSFEKINLLKYARKLRRAETSELSFRARLNCWHSLFMAISVFGFILFSLWCLSENIINATGFIYVNTLFTSISGMIFHTTWLYNNISSTYGQMNSALETLAVEPAIKDKKGAAVLKAKKAGICFDNVGFAYNGKKMLFDGLSLDIRPGEKIGLVGASGSGKSTFIKLLSRYFDVNQGAIKINGCDLRDVTQESLHQNIAVIPQDISLFNRSLYDNIRYGRTNAGRDDIEKASKQAFADEFIKGFPDGYQTIVGERGVILSGGERQRIAIARAILKNAPILVFDEATSALDSQSEVQIQKSLKKLMKDKTVIAIAHRLSTLREMDRILVFDDGKIIEEGSHLSLLRKKGVYAKLYKMQADGFVK